MTPSRDRPGPKLWMAIALALGLAAAFAGDPDGGFGATSAASAGAKESVRGDACRPMFPEPIAMRTFCDGPRQTVGAGREGRRLPRVMKDGVPVPE